MIKSILKPVAKSLGYKVLRDRPEPPVDPRVTDLIRSLRPVTTDVPLFRAGGDSDGAYLVPDDLEGITALFSPGVDQVASFEEEMAGRGMRCYLADASVDAAPISNPRFHFERKFLGLADEGDFITLDGWVNRHQPGDSDLMLQMDIEGAEWLVLANMSEQLLSRFRVIVIEFHFLTRMFDDLGAHVIPVIMNRLLNTHHVVHNHPNNVTYIVTRHGVGIPDLIELTFLRKDRAAATGLAKTFPHPLDILNLPDRPPVDLPVGWHG